MALNITPCPPTGNGRQLILPGNDLVFAGIDNIFVYPTLDVDRLKEALSHTLSIWPIVAGRILVDNDQYMIEFSDQPIPFTYIENDQLKSWPNLPIVLNDTATYEPFIDSVKYKPNEEPLLRIKVTRLLHSDEYVMGTSFSHVVGDAASNLHFLNDLSQIYQGLEPSLPHPVFERHLWSREDADSSLLSTLKPYRNAIKQEIASTKFAEEQATTEPINLSFSSTHLTKLHILAGGKDEVTLHDALCAYMIVTMNKISQQLSNGYFQRAYSIVNYRNVSDLLAPAGHIGNSFHIMLTSNFPDPFSLISIAKTIRQGINIVRNEDFLNKYLPTTDLMMREIIKNNKVNCIGDEDEVVINSNFKYDWSNQVDFSMKNQCRYHTIMSLKSYFRIFRLNPRKNNDGHWSKDDDGAQVAFRIQKGEMKDKFLETCQRDFEEDFLNVK